MSAIRFSQLKNRSALSPVPAIGAIKLQAITGSGTTADPYINFNINATDLTSGTDAVDQTFIPTSTRGQSGIALSFLDPQSSSFSIKYNTSGSGESLETFKFKVNQVTSGSGESSITTNNIGYTLNDVDQVSVSLEDIKTITTYGYIQEGGTATSAGIQGFIEDGIRAALNSRIISEISLAGHGIISLTKPLVEGDIAHSIIDGSILDLSNLQVTRYATAEIWLDIPNNLPVNPTITWPSGTWLELSQPETLTKGNRYVIVIRNDGTETSAHYVLNLAYQYEL